MYKKDLINSLCKKQGIKSFSIEYNDIERCQWKLSCKYESGSRVYPDVEEKLGHILIDYINDINKEIVNKNENENEKKKFNVIVSNVCLYSNNGL